MAPWDVAGGGGGMLGGVARGCVFTSAGESGIAAALSVLLAGREREVVRGTLMPGPRSPRCSRPLTDTACR